MKQRKLNAIADRKFTVNNIHLDILSPRTVGAQNYDEELNELEKLAGMGGYQVE
jgi:hypothetical protein